MKGNGKNKAKLLEILAENGGNIWGACREIDIAPKTFYEWKEKDKDFAEKYEELKKLQFDFVESKLFDLIDMNNPAAIMFWLKCRAKDKGYVEKSELKVETDGEFRIQLDGGDEEK